jgi:hypothetical protein
LCGFGHWAMKCPGLPHPKHTTEVALDEEGGGTAVPASRTTRAFWAALIVARPVAECLPGAWKNPHDLPS